MAGTVDYRLALKARLDTAQENGHLMYHVGSIKFRHSDKTEHIQGLYGGVLFGCLRHSKGCRAIIWTMCSDGTDVKNLGLKGTIHMVLNTSEAEYGCGVEPNVMTKPEHFHPGTTTKH